jgi:transcription elongation GreA/GreB family factor
MDAAAELRRQHERITELEALLRRSTSVLESPRRDFQVETGLLLDIRAKLGGRG